MNPHGAVTAQLVLFGELASERTAREREERAFQCLDCDVDTLAIREYYFVRSAVWAEANPGIQGMLCIACLERRLGRHLGPHDFEEGACNQWWAQMISDRLRSRMTDRQPSPTMPAGDTPSLHPGLRRNGACYGRRPGVDATLRTLAFEPRLTDPNFTARKGARSKSRPHDTARPLRRIQASPRTRRLPSRPTRRRRRPIILTIRAGCTLKSRASSPRTVLSREHSSPAGFVRARPTP
jgi:hypothetical protein